MAFLSGLRRKEGKEVVKGKGDGRRIRDAARRLQGENTRCWVPHHSEINNAAPVSALHNTDPLIYDTTACARFHQPPFLSSPGLYNEHSRHTLVTPRLFVRFGFSTPSFPASTFPFRIGGQNHRVRVR